MVIIKVYFLLGDGVNAGLHHRQAFTAFDIVWKLLDTCREETGESLLVKSKLIKFNYEFSVAPHLQKNYQTSVK